MSKREAAIAIMEERGIMDVSRPIFVKFGDYQGLAERLTFDGGLLETLLADMIWEG